jgi:hypothetical protein
MSDTREGNGDLRRRAFSSEAERHHGNALRAAKAARLHLDALIAELSGAEPPSSLLAYNSRQLTANAAELAAEAGALIALEDVKFIIWEAVDNTSWKKET